jgi:long-subunit fatty acid transport protein
VATLYRSLAMVAALVGVMATHASAGGFGIPEYGVRRTAMAATIGRPDELSALYHNPAGLVLSDEWRIYIQGGLSIVSTEFELRPWDRSDEFLGATPEASGYYRPVKPTRAIGIVPMIAAGGKIRDKLHVGAALYVGNATGAQFDEDAVTHYHLIDGYIVAPQLTVGAAYQINDSIAVGATAGLIYFKVHGRRYVFPVVDGNDISNLAGTTPELVLDGSAIAPVFSAGVFGKPDPRVTWGAAVITKVNASLEGPIEVTYSDDASTPGDMLVGSQKTTQMLPWTGLAGVNVDVHPNVEVGSEFRYWLYRQYEEQYTEVVGIFLLRELRTQKNYRDSWQLSGGARVHDLAAVPGLELMGGLHYDRTPAPSRTVTLDQPSFSHIGLHSGGRYSTGRFTFGASYVHLWYRIPLITDSITLPPSNVRATGSNNVFFLSMETRL